LTIWKPDTCDCKLEYNKNAKFVKVYNKCRLHRGLNSQILFDTVLAQNQRFNASFLNPTEEQINIITEAKRVNVERIKTEDLTNFDEQLPHEELSVMDSAKSIFSKLKALLRL